MSKPKNPGEKIFLKLNDDKPVSPHFQLSEESQGTQAKGQWTNKPVENAPYVILGLTAYKKIMLWTVYASTKYNNETSGLGTVIPRHGGLYIHDVWLIEPEANSASHVHQDPKAVGALMKRLYEGNGTPRFSEITGDFLGFEKGRDMKNLRLLWHTHNNFGVGWSGRDDATAKYEFCPDAKWTLNICVNAHGHFLARQDFPSTWNPMCPKCGEPQTIRTVKQKCSCGELLPEPRQPINHLPVRLLLPIAGQQSHKYKKEYDEKHSDGVEPEATDVSIEDLVAS
jgi:hypothetical protein